jgi:hypothetical protein
MRGRGLAAVTESPAAAWVSRAIVVIAGLGALTAATVAFVALIRQHPTPGLTFLIVPAVPALIVGQAWTVAVIRSRTAPRPPGAKFTVRSREGQFNPKRFFFGALDSRVSAVLLAGGLTGWLLAMTAFPSLTDGGPAGSHGSCVYTLSNHGSITCVTRGQYQRAGAAEQRFAAGILMFLFCIHVGAAASRRRPKE